MSRSLHKGVCVAGVVLLLLVSLRFVIFSACIQLQKPHFRQEALLQSTGKDVRLFKIPLSALFVDGSGIEWKDRNKEVVIEGKFYEVITVIRKAGHADLFLIEDKGENDLFVEFFRDGDISKQRAFTLAGLLFGANFIPSGDMLLRPLAAEAEQFFLKTQPELPEGFPGKALRPPAPVDLQLV